MRTAPARSRLRETVGEDHVLALLMEEHQRFLSKLDRIDAIADLDLGELVLERRMTLLLEVHRLAEDLIAADPHHQREEEVLFPAVRQHAAEGNGTRAAVTVMLAEHETLRALLRRLERSAIEALLSGGRGWTMVMDNGRALSRTLRAHIDKENEVLYPMAFELLGDPNEWNELRGRCEAIGCCCRAHH